MNRNTIKIAWIFFALLVTNTICISAQKISEHTLIENGQLMHGLHSYDTISNAYSEFTSLFINELNLPGSFYNKFDSIDFVSFIYPPDSSFRLITWQARVAESKFTYSGCLQTKDTLYVFKNREGYYNHPDFNTMELNSANWYGCLYYNIKTFVFQKNEMHVIFGFQQPGIASSRKIMDVLWFKQGKPIFGAPVFCNKKNDNCVNRMVLEYSSNATVRLNYDEEYKMIIFDHLIKGSNPEFKGQMANFTDGSYEAYKMRKNGTWEYIEMLWHDKQKEPPTDKPKSSVKQRNIMGR